MTFASNLENKNCRGCLKSASGCGLSWRSLLNFWSSEKVCRVGAGSMFHTCRIQTLESAMWWRHIKGPWQCWRSYHRGVATVSRSRANLSLSQQVIITLLDLFLSRGLYCCAKNNSPKPILGLKWIEDWDWSKIACLPVTIHHLTIVLWRHLTCSLIFTNLRKMKLLYIYSVYLYIYIFYIYIEYIQI